MKIFGFEIRKIKSDDNNYLDSIQKLKENKKQQNYPLKKIGGEWHYKDCSLDLDDGMCMCPTPLSNP